MSQLTSLSQISDIISDVDCFIEENGISEDVKNFMTEDEDCELINSGDCKDIVVKMVKMEHKPSLAAEFHGRPDYPPGSHYKLQFPPDQPDNLSREEYAGPFDFNIAITTNPQKAPWEYSKKLKKLFIGINLKFPIEFTLKSRPKNVNLYVRATPVYSQSQHFQEIVGRCVGHQLFDDPSNKDLPKHIHQHVMRGTSENIRYCGSKDDGTRLNIVVPLTKPQTGSNAVKEFYQFMCKNSCPMGMNRKPIDVVFTLEDESGKIFGRRLLPVRICSSPKRDRGKEEKDFDKNNNLKTGRKRSWENATDSTADSSNDNVLNVDTRIFQMNINIVGKDNYLHVLKTARDLMAAGIIKHQKKGADKPFRRAYNEFSRFTDEALTKE